jgi:hypothetical protein
MRQNDIRHYDIKLNDASNFEIKITTLVIMPLIIYDSRPNDT